MEAILMLWQGQVYMLAGKIRARATLAISTNARSRNRCAAGVASRLQAFAALDLRVLVDERQR
jgi:hypothetical protein